MPRAFVIILLILSARLHSQIPGASTFLTVNEGLSQGMAYDVLQSQDGFMWIATKAELNRYGGARFKIYSHDPFDPFSIATMKFFVFLRTAWGKGDWFYFFNPQLQLWVGRIGDSLNRFIGFKELNG